MRPTTKLMAEVDRLLWEEWDPIGVNENPVLRDEYGSYTPGVVRLLCEGAEIREIAAHLERLEVEEMGLPPDHERAKLLAAKIVQIRITCA